MATARRRHAELLGLCCTLTLDARGAPMDNAPSPDCGCGWADGGAGVSSGRRDGELTVRKTHVADQEQAEALGFISSPTVRVEDAVEAWVMRGEVALGLGIDSPREEQLIAEPLFQEGMVLVASATSPLRGRTLRPADLVGQRFLMREMGSATRRQQEAILQEWGWTGRTRGTCGVPTP